MSLTSKIVLGVGCGLSLFTIGFVHFKQWLDKQNLHEGVIRDLERRQKKKTENLYFLQQQIEMGKMLRKKQNKENAIELKLAEESKEKAVR